MRGRFTYVDQYTGLFHDHEGGNENQTDRFILSGQFMQWDRAAVDLLNTTEGSLDNDKIVVMQIHHRTMITLLEDTLGFGECHLDAFQWTFEDVVTFIAELSDRSNKPASDDGSSSDSEASCTFGSSSSTLSIDLARSRTTTPLPQAHLDITKKHTRPAFALDTGIIFSLFWTAVKCRDGLIRRRAISLLEQSSQEGVWIGVIQAAIAKRVVEIEEEQPYEQNPEWDSVKVAADIREEVRVMNVGSDVDKVRRRARVVLKKRREEWMGIEGEEECYECVEWVYW